MKIFFKKKTETIFHCDRNRIVPIINCHRIGFHPIAQGIDTLAEQPVASMFAAQKEKMAPSAPKAKNGTAGALCVSCHMAAT